MSDSKNEAAWRLLFEKYPIDEAINKDGYYTIRASDINEFREARLMTKFDHRFQLPATLSDRKLSILPISRGSYVLSKIETFENFTECADIAFEEFTLPLHIESIDFSTITSESLAINCAYVSQILADFTQDENLLPTVSGRMSSRSFDFRIRKVEEEKSFLHVNVQNAQVEIDGGYEGVGSLNLIEAKNSLSSDFLIRQLYYPYRLWENRIRKTVRPIFLVYTNGVFHFREYRFCDPADYSSIVLVREKKYRLKDRSEQMLNMEALQKILHTVRIADEPTDVPFPQADSFERIINLCEILYNNTDEDYSKEALSSNYDFKEQESFDMRQVDYYTNAAIYLGFVRKTKTENGMIFELTDLGRSLFGTESIVERQLKFIQAILSHSAFNRTLALYLQKVEAPTKEEVVQIMKESRLYNVNSESTFRRRASTILSWIEWILETIDRE
jgi:hypothetical protein